MMHYRQTVLAISIAFVCQRPVVIFGMEMATPQALVITKTIDPKNTINFRLTAERDFYTKNTPKETITVVWSKSNNSYFGHTVVNKKNGVKCTNLTEAEAQAKFFELKTLFEATEG